MIYLPDPILNIKDIQKMHLQDKRILLYKRSLVHINKKEKIAIYQKYIRHFFL